MDKKHWLDLQLFAEGGTGDGGTASGGAAPAETGENSADAGRKHLLEMGVPAAKITDGRARAVGRALKKAAPSAAAGADGSNAGEQAAAAAATENHEEEGKQTAALPEGLTWEQIMADPAMNKRMQETVKAAKKDGGKAKAALDALAPALEVLARKYGMDPANPDYSALARQIESEDEYYEARALQMGTDVQTAKEMDQRERTAQRQQRQQQLSQQETQMQEHYMSLVQQAKAMAEKYPGFDLRQELQNPAFARLSSPALIQAMGGLEGVYEHVHRTELRQSREAAAAELARQQAAKAIQAGGYRPGELGSGQAAAAADIPMTPERMWDIAERVRRGEKIAL